MKNDVPYFIFDGRQEAYFLRVHLYVSFYRDVKVLPDIQLHEIMTSGNSEVTLPKCASYVL